ncbi:hypothetical protein B0T25DRAFT_249420 [Lasiosphaeria hispida]|uniref:Uncharacterized protein n=1 Tax=Lasiosphaeria hispida TaxID=260671 RepID=A0AAJ0MCP4_9PEZI|nr:hypothetical protein B0T25DRAFT_249420 [Lasiosphaeria hispida]
MDLFAVLGRLFRSICRLIGCRPTSNEPTAQKEASGSVPQRQATKSKDPKEIPSAERLVLGQTSPDDSGPKLTHENLGVGTERDIFAARDQIFDGLESSTSAAKLRLEGHSTPKEQAIQGDHSIQLLPRKEGRNRTALSLDEDCSLENYHDRAKRITWVPDGKRSKWTFTFYTSDLPTFHHLQWNTSPSALAALQITIASDATTNTTTHSITPSSPPTLLTHMLNRDLPPFLTDPLPPINTIYRHTLSLLRTDPGTKCPICGEPRAVKAWRPTTCRSPHPPGQNSGCATVLAQDFPLRERVAPLLWFPEVLDLLLCLVREAYEEPRRHFLYRRRPVGVRCPVGEGRLLEVIDSFPLLERGVEVEGVVGTGELVRERGMLMAWLGETFTGCLVPVPEGCQVPGMTGKEQFLLLNSDTEHEKTFEECVARLDGEDRNGDVGAGEPHFHGTAPVNLLRILSHGLRNGRADEKVWFSPAAAESLGYIISRSSRTEGGPEKKGRLAGWKRSKYVGGVVLFGCEVATDDDRLGNRVKGASATEDKVQVKYVFVLPSDAADEEGRFKYSPTPLQSVRPTMREAFSRIRQVGMGTVGQQALGLERSRI